MSTAPSHTNAGFTFIEFVVIISIFTIMAGISLANYGGFSKSIELSNTAQDIALFARRAQNYGISASSDVIDPIAGPTRFGINFIADNQGQIGSMILYRKPGGSGIMVGQDNTADIIERVSLAQSDMLVGVCQVTAGACMGTLPGSNQVEFERPYPEPLVSGGITQPVMIRVTAPGVTDPWYVVIGATGNIYVKR